MKRLQNVYRFSGKSGSGKTTLLCKIISRLTEKGLRVAVAKTTHHLIEMDKPGKDSFQLKAAGAKSVSLLTPERTYTIQETKEKEEMAGMVSSLSKEFDLVLLEGFSSLEINAFTFREGGEVSYVGNNEKKSFHRDKPEEMVALLAEEKCNAGSKLTHVDEAGNVRMVDVGEKNVTRRVAVAAGRILMKPETLGQILTGTLKKGSALTTAQLAGIMAAKKTSDLIPLCHALPLEKVEISFEPDRKRGILSIQAEVSTSSKTGVEMEALTAVSVACLTIYDMAKALQKDMVIEKVELLSKSGGKSGDFGS